MVESLSNGGFAVERDPHKIGVVLGDPTRFSIYQLIVSSGVKSVTAQEIAGRFGLHPNVARMHLNKLKEVGLLVARAEKSGKGGRPGLAYASSGKPLSLNFPPREYRLLSELLCQALSVLGAQGLAALEEVARNYGRQVADQVYDQLGVPPQDVSVEDLLASAAQTLTQQGLDATVVSAGTVSATLRLNNCSFEEVAARYPLFICHLCRGLVRGVLEAHLDVARVRGEASILRGDRSCDYVAEHLSRL